MSDLSLYAASESNSKGRLHKESKPGFRSEFQRDRDRIVHSAAFRRLEYKTQVFVNHEGDMFRTRLTHSIEVAQIGRSIARALNINEDLTEAICLAHDLGHTPFGHAGQDALNQCMKDHGGFEHNLQSLRVVDVLEEKYAEFPGLNLTFETREGILKHCSKKNARELGELGERFLEGTQPSLEAQIANIADEIAYNNHDIDDGLRAGLLDISMLKQCELFDTQYQMVTDKWSELSKRQLTHEVIRRMINLLVSDLINTTQQNIQAISPNSIDDVRLHGTKLVTLSDETKKLNIQLKQFLRKNMYQHYLVNRMTHKAQKIITTLFNVFDTDVSLLPNELQAYIKTNEADKYKTIADYIAGMTDRYAIAEYERIENPLISTK